LEAERRPDDCESVALDCPGVTFGEKGALSREEDAFTKRSVALSIETSCSRLQERRFRFAVMLLRTKRDIHETE
jgi:hypothetical protein